MVPKRVSWSQALGTDGVVLVQWQAKPVLETQSKLLLLEMEAQRQEKGPYSTSLRNEGVQLTGRGLLSECQGLRRGGGTGRHHQWRWKRLVDGAERQSLPDSPSLGGPLQQPGHQWSIAGGERDQGGDPESSPPGSWSAGGSPEKQLEHAMRPF